ncbi:flagellar protein FlaG [Arsukibacterium sp.]|uniref:flagellar protein FlaG n=1 Tax=Arsukibacterium sp. TaxID=1977258 RepID=UPI0035674E98
MSVETLFSKDNRLADPGLDRQVMAKAARPDAAAQADSAITAGQQPLTENVARVNAIQKNEKTSTEPAEKSVRTIEFDTIQIRQTLEQISKLIPIANTRLVFEFDELGDPPIIKVIDKNSNELIREIPSQDLLKVAQAFSEMADNLNKAGALINFKA